MLVMQEAGPASFKRPSRQDNGIGSLPLRQISKFRFSVHSDSSMIKAHVRKQREETVIESREENT